MAYCNEVLGLAAFSRNHLSEARDLFNKAIEIFDKLGDRRNVASVLIHLARTAYRQGEFESAGRFIDKSLEVSRQLNVQWTLGLALEITGLLDRSQGRYDRALARFQESLKISVNQGNWQGIANCLGAIAGLASRPWDAAHLFAASQKTREEIEARMGEGDQAEYNEYLTRLRQQLDDDEFNNAWTHGYTMTIDQAVEIAMNIHFSSSGSKNEAINEVENYELLK
jgi:tetratricopeptide (TPR) repeat protein